MKHLACGQAKELLIARELNLELGPESKEALERHLSVCEKCREELVRKRRISELLEEAIPEYAANPEANPEGLEGRIAGALPLRSGRRARRSVFLSWEAAAAVLLFGVGILVGRAFTGGREDSGGGKVASEAGNKNGTPGEKHERLEPVFVGNSGALRQRVVPGDRVRTSDVRRWILKYPGKHNVILELDHKSVLEDPIDAADPEKEEKKEKETKENLRVN